MVSEKVTLKLRYKNEKEHPCGMKENEQRPVGPNQAHQQLHNGRPRREGKGQKQYLKKYDLKTSQI